MIKILFFSLLLWGSFIQAEVVNYETEGNLKSYHDIGCTGLEGLTNQYTPADILLGVRQCLIEGEYEKALGMKLVSSVYGKFDKLRVQEKTAHQALEMLDYNYFSQLDPKIIEAYRKHSEKVENTSLTNCPTLYRIGKPDYHPVYMIAHGLTLFFEEKSADGLVEGFDADKTWQDLLINYAKCEKAIKQNELMQETVDTTPVEETMQPEMDEEAISDSQSAQAQDPVFTEVCAIEGEYYTIMSNDYIYEAKGEMTNVGYLSDPLDETCVFDMIIGEARYCVTKEGDVFADQEESLGLCQSCQAEECYQLITNPE